MIKKNLSLNQMVDSLLSLVDDLGDKQKLRVRDIMDSEVITVSATQTAQEAAKLMMENEIGSVVIIETKNPQRPIGILTERDMNNRIVAENKLPSDIICKDIMSTPVKSISPDILLIETMHQMATEHIKRLIVMEQQKMVGIISQSDILEIAPYMIEILQDMAQMAKESHNVEYSAGYCQKCENWSDHLEEIDQIYVCENCRIPKKPSDF